MLLLEISLSPRYETRRLEMRSPMHGKCDSGMWGFMDIIGLYGGWWEEGGCGGGERGECVDYGARIWSRGLGIGIWGYVVAEWWVEERKGMGSGIG